MLVLRIDTKWGKSNLSTLSS